MSKHNILFLINDFTVGGAQKLLIDEFNYLDRKSYELFLVTLFEFKDKEDFFDQIPDFVHLTRLDFRSAKDIKGWLSFIKTLKNIKPNLVISGLFLSNFISRVLKPFFGYQCIAIEHNTYVNKRWWEIWLDRILSYLTFRIVGVSRSVVDFTAKQEKISLKKFQVINNGVDLKNYKPVDLAVKEEKKKKINFKSEDKLIISVGRLTPQKNQKQLIEAFSIFSKKHPEYKLIILGQGGLFNDLSALINQLNISNNIFLLGSKQNLIDYYQASDFFASTSLIEGFGIAHVEAMACGLPILTTKTAGPDEMLTEGVNGYFIEAETGSICEGLEKMLKLNINRVCENSIKTSKKYDIKYNIEKYQELIEKSFRA